MSKATRERWVEANKTKPNGHTTGGIVAMKAEVVNVTPAMAKKWLEKEDEYNRDAHDGRVDTCARDMSAGQWHLNGQPIQFDVHGGPSPC